MMKKTKIKVTLATTLALSSMIVLDSFILDTIMIHAQDTTTQETTLQNSNNIVHGKVTAINGTSVTVRVGTFRSAPPTSSGDQNQNLPTTPPNEQSNNTSRNSNVNQPPEKPNGELTQIPPAGFEENGEEITYDLLNAEIVLETDEGEQEATIENISSNNMLLIELSQNNTVTKVIIQQAMPMPFRQAGRANTDGSSSSGIDKAPLEQNPSGQTSTNFGGSGQVNQGTSATTIEEDTVQTDVTYTSINDDENALRIVGATVELNNITVSKEAGNSSNTEDGDFYGMNAGLLATDGATITIKDSTVNTSVKNGNGLFAYGSGTTVNVLDTTITTTNDNSGGIQTTGGGTTNATNLVVHTAGNSSAAIRSDRGGGLVNVTGGTYTTTGNNSPAAYSTAEININDATLVAEDSEALVIEGQNSLNITNSTITGNMSDTNGASSDINVHNVMIYQSMSGDAEVGLSTFTMTGGSLTGLNGDMFYVTNTASIINLSNVVIDNQDSDGNLMTISGNNASHGWGTAGENGAQVVVNADNQVLEGKIVVDTISTLVLNLTNGSTLTGIVEIVENAEGGSSVDNNAIVTIDESSVWNLTGDVAISSLDNSGTINFNGYTITLADGTVLSE